MGNQGWPIIGYRTANESGRQMEPKKTMTLNLSVEEMTALEELASEKELSKTGVIRQALRLYQLIHERTQNAGTVPGYFLYNLGEFSALSTRRGAR